jgi:antitoxin ParD1/3/4
MARVEKRTVSLRQEQAALIDDCVASGAYAFASEVVRAGLRALEERDAAVSRWLRDEVAPVYDAMQAAAGGRQERKAADADPRPAPTAS